MLCYGEDERNCIFSETQENEIISNKEKKLISITKTEIWLSRQMLKLGSQQSDWNDREQASLARNEFTGKQKK